MNHIYIETIGPGHIEKQSMNLNRLCAGGSTDKKITFLGPIFPDDILSKVIVQTTFHTYSCMLRPCTGLARILVQPIPMH